MDEIAFEIDEIAFEISPCIQGCTGHLKTVAILLENVTHVIDEVEGESVFLVDFVLAAELDAIGVMFRQLGVGHSIRSRRGCDGEAGVVAGERRGAGGRNNIQFQKKFKRQYLLQNRLRLTWDI